MCLLVWSCVQDGTITVLNFASGAVMKRAFHKHAGEVTAIAYVPEDRLIVSVSWDRNIHIYDEVGSNDMAVMVRTK